MLKSSSFDSGRFEKYRIDRILREEALIRDFVAILMAQNHRLNLPPNPAMTFLIIAFHHRFSSSLFIIAFHHRFSSSLFIIAFHHRFSSSLFIIAFHHHFSFFCS
jgi:hypothetical protein